MLEATSPASTGAAVLVASAVRVVGCTRMDANVSQGVRVWNECGQAFGRCPKLRPALVLVGPAGVVLAIQVSAVVSSPSPEKPL